jgi:hypothetical protein
MQVQDKKQLIWGVVTVMVVIAVIWGFASFNGGGNGGTNPSLDAFAKCLADKNLTMYGSATCSHCLNQKKLFGSSFKYAKYVECPDNIKMCTDLGILGYPTWIDGTGKKYQGEQSLAKLADIAGCVLPN